MDGHQIAVLNNQHEPVNTVGYASLFRKKGRLAVIREADRGVLFPLMRLTHNAKKVLAAVPNRSGKRSEKAFDGGVVEWLRTREELRRPANQQVFDHDAPPAGILALRE